MEKMRSYYIELTRCMLQKAQDNVREAQQFMAQGNAYDHQFSRLKKVMISLRNLQDEFGAILRDNNLVE
jgi:hypothetical protein